MTWDEAVRRYSHVVISLPYRLGLSRADAEDVLQRTWATALRKSPTPPPREHALRWLLAIAYWTARDVQRARRPEPVPPDTLSGRLTAREEPPAELVQHLERQQLVREALAELSSADRRLLEALFVATDSSSYRDVARRLGIASSGIGARRGRALARLRDALARRGIDS